MWGSNVLHKTFLQCYLQEWWKLMECIKIYNNLSEKECWSIYKLNEYSCYWPTQEQHSLYSSPRQEKQSLQQEQFLRSHLQDCVSIHLLTTLAHTASLQLFAVSMKYRVVTTTTNADIHRNILFQPEANKKLRKLLHSAAQCTQNVLHSVKWDMTERLLMVGGNRMAKFNVLFGICCRDLRKPIQNFYSG